MDPHFVARIAAVPAKVGQHFPCAVETRIQRPVRVIPDQGKVETRPVEPKAREQHLAIGLDGQAVRTITPPHEVGADVPWAAAEAGIERPIAIEPHQIEVVVRQISRNQELAIGLESDVFSRSIHPRRGNAVAAPKTRIQCAVSVEAHQTDLIAAIGRVPGQDNLAIRLQDCRFGASDDSSQRNAVPTSKAGIQRAINVIPSQTEVIAAAAVTVPGDENLAVRLENGFLTELPSRPEASRGLPIPHAKGGRIVHRAHRHSGVIVGASAAVSIGEHIADSACPGGESSRIRIFIGDIFDERRDNRGCGTAIERDHEIAAVTTPGEGPDGHAAIGDVRPAHADLPGPRPLVPDAEHIFGAVPAGANGDGQRASIEI